MKRVVALLALAACNPILVAESPAPPGRTARLDAVDGFWAVKSYRLELSAGTAIAFACARGASCEHMTVTSDAPAIADVHPAALAALRANPFDAGQQPVAVAVIVGHRVGTAHVHIHAAEGDRDVAVTVIPQPVSARLPSASPTAPPPRPAPAAAPSPAATR